MSLRVMLAIGVIVLMMGAVLFFNRSSPSVSQHPAKPIGNSTLSHGGNQGVQK